MSSVAQPTVSDFYAPVLNSLEQVKHRLVDVVPPDSQLLAMTLHQSLHSGGKYLRPAVTLLSGLATGQVTDKLEEVAAVSEMIHIATLLHDDVLDEADLRRGQQTVRAQWGNTVSVLSGDYLLAQASLKLANVGIIRLVSVFAHVLADLCDGEVEQIRSSFDLETTWESYYRKTICKTASLFAAGCESAGVLNNLPESQIQALREYGKNFGIAFQIVDDLLDYTSSEAEMGKPVLGDLRQGLLNAPVLLALDSSGLSETARQALRQQIEVIFQAEEPQAKVAADALRGMLAERGAIEQTVQLAEAYVGRALEALSFVSASDAKTALEGLASSVLRRRT